MPSPEDNFNSLIGRKKKLEAIALQNIFSCMERFLKSGDVVLVDFGEKQNHRMAENHLAVFLWKEGAIFEVLPITSLVDNVGKTKTMYGRDFIVKKGVGNLDCDSIIRTHQLHPICREQIIKYIGRLPEEMLDKMQMAIIRQMNDNMRA